MSRIHQLILDIGVDEAKKAAMSKEERRCVDIASQVMGDERQTYAFIHSGFAVTSLPHREFADPVYERAGGPSGEFILHVESGRGLNKQPVGIPFGAAARLLLIHMASEAKRNNSPVVEMTSGVTAFMRRIGVTVGGRNAELYREQFKRIALCRLTFFEKTERHTMIQNGSFIKRAAVLNEECGGGVEWQDAVELDDTFYQSFQKHPLPLLESALHQLSGSSLALDIYVFLAYRLHVLEKQTLIPWPQLHKQFGAGYSTLKSFKTRLGAPLAQAMAAYPQAKVILDTRGMMMEPSESPIRPRVGQTGRLRLT